jgi:hypothetical protein
MTSLWVDAFSGLSGDIWVGGFLALGVPQDELRAILRALPFPELDLRVESVMRCGIRATRMSVLVNGEPDRGSDPHLEQGTHHHGHVHGASWKDVDELLKRHLPSRAGEVARAAFERLGEAEARVHGVSLDQVHFHEVGTKDSIADLSLAAAGWVALGEPAIYMGPVATGTGIWRMSHGEYPLPGPAVMLLMEGFELVPGHAPKDKELTTPTGAALAAQLASHRYAPMRFIPHQTTYAAGGWDFHHTPNACRFVMGRVPSENAELLQVETNVDDATPQQVAHAQARMLEDGALDVWVQPATFKKGRAGWVIGALVPSSQVETVTQRLVAELPTLGFRVWPVQRVEAEREFISTNVEGCQIKVKEGRWPATTTRAPEYDHCEEAAQKLNVPLKDIQKKALG